MVVVDTGPLVAAGERLAMPQLVLAEATYFVEKELGSLAEAAFLREIAHASLELHPLERSDLDRMAELIATYADFRLGTVDASVIATAERIGAATIATLDRRHFAVVRPRHADAFELVP